MYKNPKMKKTSKQGNVFSRRQFICASATLVAGLSTGIHHAFGAPAIIKNYGKPNSKINGVQIGAITYSFRSLPDQSAEATLKYITESGLSAVELMGGPAESFAGIPQSNVDRGAYNQLNKKSKSAEGLTNSEKKEFAEIKEQMEAHSKKVADWRASVSMDKFVEFRKMYASAGVKIYAFKPSAFDRQSTDAELDYGFRAAKALGATHGTLEYPRDEQRTKKLADIAGSHKMFVAYHGHTQQTPTLWDAALQESKYNAVNLDAGHYVAAGNPSVIDFINVKHDRIKSMHVKDRQTKEHGQANLPWGQGDTPIKEILQTLRDKKYKFPASIELEYQIPQGSNAIKEVQNCLEYCRKALG